MVGASEWNQYINRASMNKQSNLKSSEKNKGAR